MHRAINEYQFLGGAPEIFDDISEDLLGGTEKAEDAKLPCGGIIPTECPMEGAGTEAMGGNTSNRKAQVCNTGPSINQNYT